MRCLVVKRAMDWGLQRGFTLTEMVIVTSIVAILLGIAIPSYRFISTSYRMSGEINSLVGDLEFARAEALKEGNDVTVCASANGANCSGGNGWSIGWIVFSDPTGSGTVETGDPILKVQNTFTGQVPDAFNASGGVASVTFNREGFAITSLGFQGTLITLTDPTRNLTYERCVSVTGIGMVSSYNHIANPADC
jgi:type IV fimbrial biogenesis protein FimT